MHVELIELMWYWHFRQLLFYNLFLVYKWRSYYIYIILVLQFNTIVYNQGNAVVRKKDNRKLFVCLPFSMLLFRLPFFSSKLDFKDKRIRHRAKVVFVAEKVVKGIVTIFRAE